MNLYLRLLFLLFRLIGLPRTGPLEESRVSFRVLPTDCDINFHMNNGRYLSFMDLGRLHLVAQIGLLKVILRRRWGAALGAAEINFIRPLGPFQKFDLVTRVVTWDEKYGYVEQRFESGGALCAHAFVKGLFLDPGGKVTSSAVAAELGHTGAPPPMPEELRIWAELGNLKRQNA
ncbi:MAG: thioesterase family protein [Burkholderiales bacterium]